MIVGDSEGFGPVYRAGNVFDSVVRGSQLAARSLVKHAVEDVMQFMHASFKLG
jgi:hypothetical protein